MVQLWLDVSSDKDEFGLGPLVSIRQVKVEIGLISLSQGWEELCPKGN